MATDLTKYNTLIAWFTIAESVVQLTRQTVDDVATYRMTVKAIDPNNAGAGQKAANYTFTDNIGTPYKIIAIATNTIDVSDEFRQGCPVGGKVGIVHKSAYKGYSIHLPAELLYRLHQTAASNNNKFAMSILWQNDPNARRVAFTNVNAPEIADYRGELTDMDGVVFKPMEDYGQNPKFEVYQLTETGKYSRMNGTMEHQFIHSLVDGLIDSVVWSPTGELITGYYTISH